MVRCGVMTAIDGVKWSGANKGSFEHEEKAICKYLGKRIMTAMQENKTKRKWNETIMIARLVKRD